MAPTGPGKTEEPRLIEKLIGHNDVNETLQEYVTAAENYDQDFPVDLLRGPRYASEALFKVFPEDGPVPRSQLKVMDIAAGTGLVGQLMYDAGITNLDALEPSSEMIEKAGKRGIYKRLIKDVIGDQHIDVADNTYDAAVVAGAFVPGHLPLKAWDEMLRICKPGGYIINAMRLEFLFTCEEYANLMQYVKDMEDRGLWRRVSIEIRDEYFETIKQGITFVFQKL